MRRQTLVFVVAGSLVALLLAFVVSRYASPEPDGLERVSADHALDTDQEPHPLEDGPLADYSTGGIEDPGTSTGVAGVIGACAVFALAGGLAWASARRGRRDATDPTSEVGESTVVESTVVESTVGASAPGASAPTEGSA